MSHDMSISQPSSAPQSSCESPARPETRAAAEPVTLHQPLSDDVSPYSRTEWWVEVAVYPTQGCDVSGESPTFHAAMNGAAVKVHESGGQIRGLPHKQRYDIAYAALQQGVLVPRYCFKKPSKRTRRSVSASDDDDAPPSRQPPKLTKKVLGQRIIELENDLDLTEKKLSLTVRAHPLPSPSPPSRWHEENTSSRKSCFRRRRPWRMPRRRKSSTTP